MYEQIEKNLWRTGFLFAGFTVFLVLIGWLFSKITVLGELAVPLAVILALVSCLSSYYYSDRIVLGISQASPADPQEDRVLINLVEGLSLAAGLAIPPQVYVINDTAPNAFSSGRDPRHAVIAVTRGLVQKLNKTELEGVLAHEMGHIKNYDTLFTTLAVVMVGVITLLADWWWRSARSKKAEVKDWRLALLFYVGGFLLMALAPLIAQLLAMSISRRREYLADVSGAMLTRYPAGLANALEKISQDTEPLEVANKATAYLYIVNPLLDHGGALNSLFDTHPPTEERIKILRSMAHDNPGAAVGGPSPEPPF